MRKLTNLINLGVLSIFTLLIVWLAFFDGVQKTQDWWWLRSYEPSSEIEQLASDSSFSDKGRDIFYISDPQLQGQAEFNDSCDIAEISIILGCYSNRKIYVYNVDDPRIADVEEVTAAHELLHAVYERLSSDEIDKINGLLDQELKSLSDQRLLDLIELYSERDASLLSNELHSIFGTELAKISTELEEHYSVYFTDRSNVVAKAQTYATTFLDITSQLEDYDAQLTSLSSEIDNEKQKSSDLKKELDESDDKLDELLNSSELEDYNAQVSKHNELVNEYNNSLSATDALINNYNQLARERNALAYDQRSLIESIDSSPDRVIEL